MPGLGVVVGFIDAPGVAKVVCGIVDEAGYRTRLRIVGFAFDLRSVWMRSAVPG